MCMYFKKDVIARVPKGHGIICLRNNNLIFFCKAMNKCWQKDGRDGGDITKQLLMSYRVVIKGHAPISILAI